MGTFDFFEKSSLSFVNDEKKSENVRTVLKTIVCENYRF